MTAIECKNCGKVFEVNPYREDTASFCSNECRYEWQKEGLKGKNNPNWKGGKVELECEVCGGTFEVKPSHADGRRTCSKECLGVLRSEEWRGKNHPGWKEGKGGIFTTCENCGKRYFAPSSERGRFCSLECYGEWLRDKITGKNNPYWRGGHDPYYGSNWIKQRKKALERDNYACRLCGKGKRELGQNPDVHHIAPKREFDSLEEANKLSNLITLCRSCHNKVGKALSQPGSAQSLLEAAV